MLLLVAAFAAKARSGAGLDRPASVYGVSGCIGSLGWLAERF
jgi:hypothetical protein